MVSESGNVDVVLIVYMVFSATCLRCIMNNNNNNNSQVQYSMVVGQRGMLYNDSCVYL